MKVELGSRRESAAPAVSADPDWRPGGRRLAARNQVLMLQHRDEAPSARLLDVLVERGMEPVVRSVSRGDELPDPGSVRAAILVGSDRVGDAAVAGYLDAELEWLGRADDAGAAVLGIGHGARALALAFGGLVEPADHPLRGWVMVDTSIPHRIATGPWLTWQHDVIVLPPDAQLLAYNRLGPQAFRVGRHLGVQFHPEATPQTVAEWVKKSVVPLDAQVLLDATARDAEAAASCTRRLLSTFIDSI
jgi:GMP synthase (glutamine-hydrolysing)